MYLVQIAALLTARYATSSPKRAYISAIVAGSNQVVPAVVGKSICV